MYNFKRLEYDESGEKMDPLVGSARGTPASRKHSTRVAGFFSRN